MRVNETQRQLLQEVCGTLNIGGAKHKATEQRKVSGPKQAPSDVPEIRPLGEDVPSTLDTLEHLLQMSIRENTSLQRENDALRLELEQLKQAEANGRL
ncbi:hypothetical protein PHYBLDRAFT_158993 [Phycomyces blakesleeanus NRRL 1555(-)]|uniref:Uncharacterized protein n=2 Tax=Phycomyces blakesleeanus TaxID=4837 RepID=A0A163ADV4_PHYB8|nr:hypothetical protein PHYBLDRAFT_158993 [Phycomyces blakesleeanus NRRL 1555(-)]OAD72801.1 hypothetical protein PHYBLDRAFT_158993 [Phycomyces blakesleeanus NRRL 1555(-)]|eukprot:XP_018290841.1 hypothetical protein PHYBLDRAFT_158993 [Phycomyces blakesleeanus NRRL 1555(-)]